MPTIIKCTDLQVGQWVKFSTPQASQKQQEAFEHIFLVISRNDSMFDSFHCFLMDAEGKTYNYEPSTGRLGYVDFAVENTNVFLWSHPEVQCVYGDSLMRSAYEKAQIQLTNLSYYFAKHPEEKTIDVDALLGGVTETSTAAQTSYS